MGNDVDLWEMDQICGEMAKLFDKRLKNVENGLDIWEMAKYLLYGSDTWNTVLLFEKRLYYVGNGLRI